MSEKVHTNTSVDRRFSDGVALFNAGHYFAAHEVWEDLWNDLVGPEKVCLQGLIQIAAGYAKVESGVRGGAVKLLTRGLQLLRQSDPSGFGVAFAPFIEAVAADLQRLHAMPEAAIDIDRMQVPRLQKD